MNTTRATTAQALVRFLASQRIEEDGEVAPLFPGVFAIFGHGNVTCLGEALRESGDDLPTWRGHHEQYMAHAAIAAAKRSRRRRIYAVTTSIGPGALNLVTAAGTALANRLPVLFLSGETFSSRLPDPVLQQVEHFGNPTMTVNDAFKPVVRFWDRINHPAQLIQSLPHAVSTMLDPADCGPAFIALPQDVQAQAFDWPNEFFDNRLHRVRRPVPDPIEVDRAAMAIASSRRPLLIAGGGVRYSEAEEALQRFASAHRAPVAETVAGKGSTPWDHPQYVGPLGVTGSMSANQLAAETDLVLAVGTRLQDFTTGSWTVFRNSQMRLVSINAARFDASKHLALPVVGDANISLETLHEALGDWQADSGWAARAGEQINKWNSYVDSVRSPTTATPSGTPSYAQVIGVVNDFVRPDDYLVAAAGGLPGELNKTWRASAPATFDCEYGFSCMGYEVGGAWGASMVGPTDGLVVSMCGDGSYLMGSSELYSAVISGHRIVMVLCDNGGYAVIQRLQVYKGGKPFNNMYAEGTRRQRGHIVDFVAHAASLGAHSEEVDNLDQLSRALQDARGRQGSSVIVVRTDPTTWTGGDAWWEVGTPEFSKHQSIRKARADHEYEKAQQRRGI